MIPKKKKKKRRNGNGRKKFCENLSVEVKRSNFIDYIGRVPIFLLILLSFRNFPNLQILHISMFNIVEASDARWSGEMID